MSGSAASANGRMAFSSWYSLRATQSPCFLPDYEEWAYAGGTDVRGEVTTCSTSMWVRKLEHGRCHGCSRFFIIVSCHLMFLSFGIESRYCTRIFLVHGQGKSFQSIVIIDYF